VLWCGECESLWCFASDDKWRGSYFYLEMFPELCARLDPSRDYWPGTPYGGKDANGMAEGDRHAYDVYLKWQDFETYLHDTARFASEFGVQSMPNWKTLLWYAPAEERHVLSQTLCSHNKLPDGMEILTRYLVGRLGFPKDLRSFVYMTQFNQAEAMKMAIEHWRGRKFKSAGTLYWQFNDCWPCTSFSSIDYFRRKKALYHYAYRFYADVLPIIEDDAQGITLRMVNDRLQEVCANVRIACYRLDGSLLAAKTFQTVVTPNGNEIVKRLPWSDLGIGYAARISTDVRRYMNAIVEKNGEAQDAVVFVEAEVDGETYYNHHVFGRFRDLRLKRPQIQVSINRRSIELCSDTPAFAVFVETAGDVELSDNCLCLQPGVPCRLRCSAEPGAVQVADLTAMIAQVGLAEEKLV
jgi:beta-mannosidase